MNCAMNMAFANRQVILHLIREVFAEVFGKGPEALGMHQVYDVTHNTAKIETHLVEGKLRKLLVHRKGATRSAGPESKDIPAAYRGIGQPVIIGGSMETGSYLMAGTSEAAQAFSSTAHGSGRTMSRSQAKRMFHGRDIQRQLMQKGIYIQTSSYAGLAEEAGPAYKDIDEVVAAAQKAGLSRPIAKFTPVGNIKG
jgi:tRNA-splicing ligase RtcB